MSNPNHPASARTKVGDAPPYGGPAPKSRPGVIPSMPAQGSHHGQGFDHRSQDLDPRSQDLAPHHTQEPAQEGGYFGQLRGEAAPAQAALTPRTLTTPIEYTDPEGSTHRASLVSRIMTAQEMDQVARLRARLAGGLPWVSFSYFDQQRMEALALCAVQLREPPEWLERWLAVDAVLLLTVYKWLAEHDSTFFRSNLGASQGQEAQPRVVLGAGGAA